MDTMIRTPPKSTRKSVPEMSFANLHCTYDPFPFGVAGDVFPDDVYQELLDNWPATELFQFMPKLGKKYSLAEVNNGATYHAFLRAHPCWMHFHEWIKSRRFLMHVLDTLADANLDLGLRGEPFCAVNRFSPWPSRAWAAVRRRIRQWTGHGGVLRTRFEFSMMPADGGHIKPHTDHFTKLITLVVTMVREGEWDSAWGGGTEMLAPRDMTHNFNFLNVQGEFGDYSVLEDVPFVPNQCAFFIKTFNSHHAVFPMTGKNTTALRKTLTINIERAIA